MQATLSLCAFRYSRFWFGGPYLESYSGSAGIEKLVDMTEGKRVLLMVPGFNNSAARAQSSFDTIADNLTGRGMLGPDAPYQVAIGVLWPGQSAAGFGVAQLSADKAGDELHDILVQINPSVLDIEGHSLGCGVALQANRRGDLRVRNYILASAAIGNDCLESRYQLAVANVKTCLVCYSRRDGVLGEWFTLWERLVGTIKPEDSEALGHSGPRDLSKCPPTVKMWDATTEITDHGAWRQCADWYTPHWHDLLS